MGQAAKIATVAVLGGLLIALAILHSSSPAPDASRPNRIGAETNLAAPIVSERCRTVTVADTECAAAWEAKRRQFFGQKD